MKAIFKIQVAVLVLLVACFAQARTWFVEKDGSGDFTVIQDAVDAAAPGDTIRIGSGRFTEYQYVYDQDTYVLVETDSLTFWGSGVDSTIIGPESPRGSAILS